MFKKRVVKKKDETVKRKLEEDGDEEVLQKPVEFKKRTLISNKKSDGVKIDSKIDDDRLKDIETKKKELKKEEEGTKAGPIKAPPQNIRTTTLTDFQPDVCKDYLQTGYCGYGDTCKFLHIRDELRQKKKIEKDWQIESETKVAEKEQLPFKCVLCKQDYKAPIKTDCGHIYCKSCFLSRYKQKKSQCFICGSETNGVLKPLSKVELAELIE